MLLVGQRGQLEVVGGEQRVAAVLVGQVAGHCVGQCQAVVGGGATADLIHQHQRMRGGVMQDVAGLGHFDHEGRLPAGEVIAGADAGEDAVDRPDQRTAGRHEAADVGQQHDQRVLPHVGRFTAHVRAGDDQHATVRMQVQIIGFERLLAYRLDHRVAAALDLQARLCLQLRARPVQRLRAFGEGGQHIQFAQRSGALLQRFQLPAKGIQQLFVQILLARQRTVTRGQHLVLERLQFLGDVALGIGQRLAARVVHRRTIGLALADFDVVAVHTVVAHLQGGNAAALALAQFQVDQELVGMGGQAAQLVQLFIEAIGEHAAVAQLQRRHFGDGAGQQLRALIVFAQRGMQGLQARRIQRRQHVAHRRQQAQAIAQGGEIARTRRAQRDAGENAFQVTEAAELLADIGVAAAIDQGFHRVVALHQHLAHAQRAVQPAPQQAPAHRRDGAVEHAQQRVAGIAVNTRIQFQVAAGGGIHRDRLAGGFHRDRGQVRQPLLLGLLDIAKQGTGGSGGARLVIDAEAAQIMQLEEVQQLTAAAVGIEQPRCTPAHAGALAQELRPVLFVGHQQLGRLQAGQFGFQRVVGFNFIDQEAATGQVGPGQAVTLLAARERHQQGVAALVQQRFVGDRAGGDDAHHLALDQALGQRRVADLLADRH